MTKENEFKVYKINRRIKKNYFKKVLEIIEQLSYNLCSYI